MEHWQTDFESFINWLDLQWYRNDPEFPKAVYNHFYYSFIEQRKMERERRKQEAEWWR